MAWPHLAYLAAAAAVVGLAIATAWRYGSRVVRENRVWTCAWLILLSSLAMGPGGWLVPFGAIYVIARYGKVWRPDRLSA